MIQVEWFYWLMGLFWLGVGVLVARDRTNPKRLTSGLFWALLGLCFPYSSFVDTTYGFTLAPLQVALWAIPTAVVALLIHGTRSLLVDRALRREMAGFVPEAVAR